MGAAGQSPALRGGAFPRQAGRELRDGRGLKTAVPCRVARTEGCPDGAERTGRHRRVGRREQQTPDKLKLEEKNTILQHLRAPDPIPAAEPLLLLFFFPLFFLSPLSPVSKGSCVLAEN